MSVLTDESGRPRLVWRLVLFTLAVAVCFAVAVSAVGVLARWVLPEAAGEVPVVLLAGIFSLLAVVGASGALMAWMEGSSLAALGLPLDGVAPGEFGRGTALGLAFIALAVLPLALAGSVTWTFGADGVSAGGLAASLALTTTFLILAAQTEEVLIRGYPLQAIAEKLGGPAAIGLTAIVFSLLHAFNPGYLPASGERLALSAWLPVVNIALAGVLLGLAYWRTYSLWFAGGLHFGWNFGMGIADLPVSGLDTAAPGYAFLDTPGLEAVVRGNELWTGGGFGPEGGLVVTLVLIAGSVWIARTGGLSRSLRVRALGTLPDGRAPKSEPVDPPGDGASVAERADAGRSATTGGGT